jgi:uncharacterized membrane protein
MRRLLISAALLGLAGCGREPPEPAAGVTAPPTTPTPRPSATAAAIQPITARGNEPFWAADVDHSVLTLIRPDHPPLTTPVTWSGPYERITWTGQDLTLVMAADACSDGMSDLTYPMSAELKLAGETLRGCAFFKADPPKQP